MEQPNPIIFQLFFRARALLTASGPVANPESASALGGFPGGGGGEGAQPPSGWRVDVLGAAAVGAGASQQAPSSIVWLNNIEVRPVGRQAFFGRAIGRRRRGGEGSWLLGWPLD